MAIFSRKAEDIANTIRQGLRKFEDIDVFLRDEIPEGLHWAHNSYSPPILILAKVNNSRAEVEEPLIFTPHIPGTSS